MTNPPDLPRVGPKHSTLFDSHRAEVEKAVNCFRVGTVVAYYPGAAGVSPPTADVQIAQQQVTGFDNADNPILGDYPLLRSIPVVFPSGGGYTLTFPVKPGDECLVLFHDRELDNWFVNGAGYAPTTGRRHDYSDGVAFVGLRSCPRAQGGVSTTTVQLRDAAGDTFLEVTGGAVNVQGNLDVSGNARIGGGYTGSFPTQTGQVVTVQNGIITNIG